MVPWGVSCTASAPSSGNTATYNRDLTSRLMESAVAVWAMTSVTGGTPPAPRAETARSGRFPSACSLTHAPEKSGTRRRAPAASRATDVLGAGIRWLCPAWRGEGEDAYGDGAGERQVCH